MSLRRLTLLIALALLALAGLGTWRALTAAEGPLIAAAPARTPESAELARVPDSGAPEAPAAIIPPSSEVATERVAFEDLQASGPVDEHLTGEVRDYLGAALPGATVEVRRRPATGMSSLDLTYTALVHPVGSAQTDAEGRFSVQVPPHRPLEVRIRAERHAQAMLSGVFGGEHLLVSLTLGAVLEGRVTRESTGQGVPAVNLRGWMLNPRVRDVLKGQTDGAGGFRFEGLPAGDLVVAFAPAKLASPGRQDVTLEPGTVVRLDLALSEGVAVTGRVTNSKTHAPIPGAEVGMGWTFRRSVTTDEQGRYTLPGFGGPGVYDIHARAAGYGKAKREYSYQRMPTEDVELNFQLDPGRSAVGRVLGQDGTPLADVYVAAVSHGYGAVHDWDATRTGSEGHFRLTSLTPSLRGHKLLVRAMGYGTLVYDFPPDETEQAQVDLGTIRLSQGGHLVGTVPDEDGVPRPGVPVTLEGRCADTARYLPEGQGHSRLSYTDEIDVITDRRGRFHFADLAPGTYTLKAIPYGRNSAASLTVTLAPGESRDDLELIVLRGLAIGGRVVDEDGRPCENVSVRAWAGDDKNIVQRFSSDKDGFFAITGLKPGFHTVDTRVLWLNYASEDRELFDVTLKDIAAGTDDLSIVLPYADPISGTVLSPDGSPATRVVISAHDPNTGDVIARGRVNAEGRFRISVPQGVLVDVRARGSFFQGSDTYSLVNPVKCSSELLEVEAGSGDLVLRLEE